MCCDEPASNSKVDIRWAANKIVSIRCFKLRDCRFLISGRLRYVFEDNTIASSSDREEQLCTQVWTIQILQRF